MAETFEDELDAHIAESMKDPGYAYAAGYIAAREDAERAIRDRADRRAETAFGTWFNPIAGALSRGRVIGLDLAADMVAALPVRNIPTEESP